MSKGMPYLHAQTPKRSKEQNEIQKRKRSPVQWNAVGKFSKRLKLLLMEKGGPKVEKRVKLAIP